MKKFTIPVDIYNQFCYNNNTFQIDRSLKQYKVANKPSKNTNGEYNDWTNEALMDSVEVHEVNRYTFTFYDLDGNDITQYVEQV